MNTFPGLVHTARQVTKVGNTQSRWPNLFGGSRLRWDWRLGLSRNKVAVPEGAAGSHLVGHAIRECRVGGFAHGWNVGFGLSEAHCWVLG